MANSKVCIVTGANSGIGKEVTAGLMAHGCHVIMGCRNQAACRHAKSLLDGMKLPGSCECASVDLQDFTSVREFVRSTSTKLRSTGRKLSVLVNNAGVMGVPPSPSGEDLHLRTNHLGPFLLTSLLLPDMTRGSRIVNVASRAHYWGHLSVTGDRIQGSPKWWFRQYGRSKLCNVLHTLELQQRLATQGICSYSVSPGLVGTNIFQSLPQPFRAICNFVAPLIMRTPAQGAETVIYAAVDPELEGRSVLFLHDRKPKAASAQGQDTQLAAALWRASSVLVGEPVES